MDTKALAAELAATMRETADLIDGTDYRALMRAAGAATTLANDLWTLAYCCLAEAEGSPAQAELLHLDFQARRLEKMRDQRAREVAATDRELTQ